MRARRSWENTEALEVVRWTVESDYKLTDDLKKDSDLASLQKDPEFLEIFAWRKRKGYPVDLKSVEENWPEGIPLHPLIRKCGVWLRQRAQWMKEEGIQIPPPSKHPNFESWICPRMKP